MLKSSGRLATLKRLKTAKRLPVSAAALEAALSRNDGLLRALSVQERDLALGRC